MRPVRGESETRRAQRDRRDLADYLARALDVLDEVLREYRPDPTAVGLWRTEACRGATFGRWVTAARELRALAGEPESASLAEQVRRMGAQAAIADAELWRMVDALSRLLVSASSWSWRLVRTAGRIVPRSDRRSDRRADLVSSSGEMRRVIAHASDNLAKAASKGEYDHERKEAMMVAGAYACGVLDLLATYLHVTDEPATPAPPASPADAAGRPRDDRGRFLPTESGPQ